MRQVNGWGFKRIVSGQNYGSYYHTLFVRSDPERCNQMERTKRISKNSTKDRSQRSKVEIVDDLKSQGTYLKQSVLSSSMSGSTPKEQVPVLVLPRSLNGTINDKESFDANVLPRGLDRAMQDNESIVTNDLLRGRLNVDVEDSERIVAGMLARWPSRSGSAKIESSNGAYAQRTGPHPNGLAMGSTSTSQRSNKNSGLDAQSLAKLQLVLALVARCATGSTNDITPPNTRLGLASVQSVATKSTGEQSPEEAIPCDIRKVPHHEV